MNKIKNGVQRTFSTVRVDVSAIDYHRARRVDQRNGELKRVDIKIAGRVAVVRYHHSRWWERGTMWTESVPFMHVPSYVSPDREACVAVPVN